MPSEALLDLVAAFEAQGVHSLMVVRRGHVVAEGAWRPFTLARPHHLWSLSKSFCATAAGFAVAEGRLRLDERVADLVADRLPGDPSENLLAMRVRDLLTMSCGHETETPIRGWQGDVDWVRAFLAHPVPHAPGTHFLYNSLSTFMVGAILREVTGLDLTEYLTPRLFDPLGIPTPNWHRNPAGIETGGWGMEGTTEAIAKFGLLYLQDGMWEGRRILPEGWVAEATRMWISNGDDPNNDWHQGYGYQFWRCRHNAYRGDGAFGQFCVVVPDHDLVVAATSGADDMGAMLNATWALLPALADEVLPASRAAVGLAARLSAAELPTPKGSATSGAREAFAGSYRFEGEVDGHTDLTLSFGADRDSFVFSGPEAMRRLVAGHGEWAQVNHGGADWAASGAWTADNVYELRYWLLENTFGQELTFRFDAHGATVTRRNRCAFWQPDPAEVRLSRV